MVEMDRVELSLMPYQSIILPLNYISISGRRAHLHHFILFRYELAEFNGPSAFGITDQDWTGITGLKAPCPNQLDDGDIWSRISISYTHNHSPRVRKHISQDYEICYATDGIVTISGW